MRTLDSQKHELQRNKIIERSRSLFAKRGFAETSMLEIGRACRLTKPALYHYFKSKEALLQSIFEFQWRHAEAKISQIPKPRNFKELLFTLGRAYLEHWDDARNLELYKITLKEGAHNSQMHENSLQLTQPRADKKILELFAPWFPEGTRLDKIRVFACQFFGSLFYYSFMDKLLGGSSCLPADREHYLGSLVEVFSGAVK